LMAVSLIVTFNLGSIGGAWKLLLVTGAGTGTVLLLRWFWWRINAWSEVSAMVAAASVSLYLQIHLKWDSEQPRDFAYLMLVTVAITTLVWLVATFVTSPEPTERLIKFYRRVCPGGPGWKRIAAVAGSENEGSRLTAEIVNWACGCVLIYASLFAIGKLIFKEWGAGIMLATVAIVAAMVIAWNLTREARHPSTEQRLQWD
jgi:SSS family solute:Na+ symporter